MSTMLSVDPWADACTIGGATGSATRDGGPIHV